MVVGYGRLARHRPPPGVLYDRAHPAGQGCPARQASGRVVAHPKTITPSGGTAKFSIRSFGWRETPTANAIREVRSGICGPVFWQGDGAFSKVNCSDPCRRQTKRVTEDRK